MTTNYIRKYFPNWFTGYVIMLTIVGTLFIGLPYLIYREITFAINCKGIYKQGRPSLCISKDGRILGAL